MRRASSVTVMAIYAGFLLTATIVQAQGAPPLPTFYEWFWDGLDWRSFGTAALPGLFGGACRTAWSLRSNFPTFRVVVECLADAVTALVAGSIAYLLIVVWQSYRGPVDHLTTLLICFVAGLLRGGLLTWIESTTKRVLAAVSDGLVSWIAAKAVAATTRGFEPPSPPPPKDAP